MIIKNKEPNDRSSYKPGSGGGGDYPLPGMGPGYGDPKKPNSDGGPALADIGKALGEMILKELEQDSWGRRLFELTHLV
jgi:hypothetical protein